MRSTPLLPATFGSSPFQLNATSSSGLPVSYSSSDESVATISGNKVTIVGAGTTIITAAQGGNADYFEASPMAQPLQVDKALQFISFADLSVKYAGDAPFYLTAMATSSLPITYVSDNPAVAVIAGDRVTIKGAGTVTIMAVQGGDRNYNAAAPVSRVLTVRPTEKNPQQISFAAPPSKTYGDQPFLLTATATSGLAINYTSSNPSVAVVSGKTVTIKSPGVTIISATQAGNASYQAAVSVAHTLTINRASQTINFGAIPLTVSVNSDPFILGASSSSGLPVSYSSDNTSVATISANKVTLTGPGWVKITATQVGNAFYKEAASVTREIYITKTLQSISFSALSPRNAGDPSFAPEATASSGLPVTYSSSNSKVAIINNGMIRLTGAGTTIITAIQPGNEVYEAAAPVSHPLVVSLVTEIEDTYSDKRTASFFPNPTSGSLHISLDGFVPDRPVSISILDGQGRNVLNMQSENKPEIALDLARLPGGVYCIYLVQDRLTATERFIKN